MATNEEILNPKALVLPSIPLANQLATAQTGDCGVSGAVFVFFNGTKWSIVTSS